RHLGARPGPREPGPEGRGERALQAGELAPPRERALRLSHSRSRLRAVVQRVAHARVLVAGEVRAEVGPGLCVLLGVGRGDDPEAAERLAGRVARLRIFEDEKGRFDRSLLDTGGAALVVSQFTLLADTAKGNRPSFSGAAPPAEAEPLYERFVAVLRSLGITVETGLFGARMSVELENDGPV